MKKNIILLSIAALIVFSCSVHKKKNTEYSDKEVIQKLKYVTNFPDDYFFPKGDSICEKILNRGKTITPLLLDKIDDTSNSDYIYTDRLQYKIGDIAINLIDNLYNKSEFPIRDLLQNEFNKEEKDYPLFLQLYDDIFFNNSEKENFENRKRFKKVVYKWYEERIK
jgi:hypothetical protein